MSKRVRLHHAPLPGDLTRGDIEWDEPRKSRRVENFRQRVQRERRIEKAARHRRERAEHARVLEHMESLAFEAEWLRLDHEHSKALAYGLPLRANAAAQKLVKLELKRALRMPGQAARRPMVAGLRASLVMLKRQRKQLEKERGK